MVEAPELLEVAQIWWDVEHAPAVTWDAAACVFHLVDPHRPASRLLLARFDAPVAEPRTGATALAEGLAACDFPPNGDGVAPQRARRTLDAAGLPVVPTG